MNLETKINDLDIKIDKDFFKRCETFISTLKEWGKIHNLSAELDTLKIEENIFDSVYVLSFLEDFKSFADIGTGAGYPGFILAMARPDIKAYLIEPRAKRVAFLNFVKNLMGLTNIEIICNRVEYVKDIEVDLITSRAVTNTKLLLEITSSIATEKTSYLFYKGSMLESELEEAKINKYNIVKRNDRNYLYIKG